MFKIDTGTIAGFSSDLTMLDATVPAAKKYNDTYVLLQLADATPIFAGVMVNATNVRKSLDSALAQYSTFLTASASELSKVAKRAAELDQQAAEELDRTFAPLGPTADGSPPPIIGDEIPPADPNHPIMTAPPGDALQDPDDPPSSSLPETILTTDWLSPTTAVSAVLGLVFHYDPVAEIGKSFGGDWEKMYKVGSALNNISEYFSRSANSLEHSTALALNAWEGYEADSASVFFAKTVQQIRDMSDRVASMGQEFISVADEVKGAAAKVGDLFSMIMDMAYAVAATSAVGGVLAETVVAPVVAGFADAAEIAVMVLWARMAWDLLQLVLEVCKRLEAATALFMQFFMSSGGLKVPVAYDNSSV
jgi:hypothetical protein